MAFGDVVRNVTETVRDPQAVGIERVIAMEHMDPGELGITRWGSLDDGTTFTRRVTPGQTLFGKRRAYQRKVAFAEFDAICSGDIYTFEADSTRMLPEFLPLLVQSDAFFERALSTSAGSLSPRTNWRDLAGWEFELPPLDEQKRIADLLWAASRHRERLYSRANSSARALQAFVGATTAVASGTPVRIVDLCAEVVGGIWGAPEGESEIDVFALGPSVYASDTGEVVTSGAAVRSITRKQAESRLLRPGDIVLERSGGSPTQPVGRVAFVADGLPPCIPTDFQRLLRPDRSTVDPRYLHWRLWHDWASGLSGRYSRKTTNITNLSVRDYLARSIRLPSPAEQEQVVARVNVLQGERAAVRSELTALARLSARLGDRLFGSR